MMHPIANDTRREEKLFDARARGLIATCLALFPLACGASVDGGEASETDATLALRRPDPSETAPDPDTAGTSQPTRPAPTSAPAPEPAPSVPKLPSDGSGLSNQPTDMAPATLEDLRPDGSMHYMSSTTAGYYEVKIGVTNVGNDPVTGPSSQVLINGAPFAAELHEYDATPLAAPYTVYRGERGYLKVLAPISLISAPCSTFIVTIDSNSAAPIQRGLDVAANDRRLVTAYQNPGQCKLTWTAPINAATADVAAGLKFVAGKSLQTIVSSVESGREDGRRCSSCHHSGSSPSTNAGVYSPSVAFDAPSPLVDPYDFIDGNTWGPCTTTTWAQAFIDTTNYDKPSYLEIPLAKWLADGGER
jgi:hypothetical protein